MEQNTETTKNYRQMTADLMRTNSVNFSVGAILILVALLSLGIRYGGPLQNFFDRQLASGKEYLSMFSLPIQNERVTTISESIKDESINYISPAQKNAQQSEGLGIAVQEDGQISAISSEQVTYKRNKYVIQPGESLQDIARKVYGDSNAWVRIAQANDITNPDHIEVGMELIIPR